MTNELSKAQMWSGYQGANAQSLSPEANEDLRLQS
jgi:hypothetical protein